MHIADATAKQIKTCDIKNVSLLGTRFTMEQDFYKQRLIDVYGLNVIIPNEQDRNAIHRIIYEELVKGIIREESQITYREIIARLIDDGAEAIILGCTEIMLLVEQSNSAVPVFDTTTIHAHAAVEKALQSDD